MIGTSYCSLWPCVCVCVCPQLQRKNIYFPKHNAFLTFTDLDTVSNTHFIDWRFVSSYNAYT